MSPVATQQRERQHLQRVPPHDDQMERYLLGAAMLTSSSEAARIVAEMEPTDFYRVPTHHLIADAIGRLVADGQPTDTGMVCALLRSDGQLDAIRGEQAAGEAYVLSLTRDTPSITSAPSYAAVIRELARKRRLLGLASEVVEAVYARTEIAGLVTELHRQVEEAAVAASSSWEPMNLAAVLAGEGAEAEPAFLRRTDGQALLYRARFHAFNADPESGKSWLALRACLEIIEAGGHVLYVDFEDDAITAVGRLLAMGAEPGQILERFHYVRPDDPIDASATLRVQGVLRTWPTDLCVVDGVGEGMATSGWNEDKAADFYAFANALPRAMVRMGSAAVIIDHLPKDPEKKNSARGSGAKWGGIDAALRLDVLKPFGRDLDGAARVVVTKDRHGHLRGAAQDGKVIAHMSLSSADGGTSVNLVLRPPGDAPDRPAFRPTELMAKLWGQLDGLDKPLSKTALRSMVPGKTAYKDIALGLLLAEGYIANSGKGFYVVRPFDPAVAPDSEQQPLPIDEEGDDDF